MHTFKCSECKSDIVRRVANLSSAITKIKKIFCCKNCRVEWNKKNCTKKDCLICGNSFKIYKSTSSRSFCSHNCYHIDQTNNPNKYGLLEKVKLAQSYSNNAISIAKMKQTKLDKGLMIDWKDANWKQYWRKCNDLTRKLRLLKIEDWDGKDYIDGEYIRDNLSLPFKDKNYPCLDHIKPKWICYQEGLTPYEACDINNLAWTKRTNNSKKGIKY